MATGCPMMKAKMETEHPCFGGDHSKAGRIHLPVAPGFWLPCQRTKSLAPGTVGGAEKQTQALRQLARLML